MHLLVLALDYARICLENFRKSCISCAIPGLCINFFLHLKCRSSFMRSLGRWQGALLDEIDSIYDFYLTFATDCLMANLSSYH